MSFRFCLRFFTIFTVLAIALVGFLDWKMFGATNEVEPSEAKIAIQALTKPQLQPFDVSEIQPAAGIEMRVIPEPILILPENGADFFEASVIEEVKQKKIKPAAMVQKKTVPVSGSPKIAIIIDDIGMDISGSEASINLPTPVTIAILPYAERAKGFATQAKNKGHELIIHTPMEAMSSNVSLGSMALRTSYSDQQFDEVFEKILNSFEGYVGMNNHMGSKLTQDNAVMNKVMRKLKERGLFFVDSRTIHTSVAAEVARDVQIPFATRNVFLDHEDTTEFVSAALKKLERIALEQGSAIAIGHPKDNTINALNKWIPQAKARGFEFVPVSALVKLPSSRNVVTGSELESGQSQPPG